MPIGDRILAVDDNPTNLAIVEEIFQGQYNLRLVSDGNEALRIAPTFLPDVVLLDVMMPRPDGYEVCSRMKNDRALQHSQVIMVSARSHIEDRLRGYKAGADDYITRPFDQDELSAKVTANLRTKSIYGSIRQEMEAMCGLTGEVLELVSHLRDAETGDHLERIRVYSQILAAELRQSGFEQQIDDTFLDDLYRASPLHDIGKIAIPDAILRKPGKLTTAEREQMKQHTLIGEQILTRLVRSKPDASFFRMAADIARWHHESFDGSGYPDGLSGTEIPLAARIVKVADVFDALTSERVYKPAFAPSVAKRQMTGPEAATFDPAVIASMLSVFDEFVEISQCPEAYEVLPFGNLSESIN